MTDVTKDLLGALRDLIDSHWLHDSHAVEFDGTVMFSPHYDFSGIDGYRRSEFRDDGIEFVVWPAGGAGRKWSAYSTYEGSMWFEKFDSEAEARAVCMKLLADVMPDHSVSRALAAIARAESALDHSADIHSSVDERRLRRMLCLHRHGASAYMDDGEATFGGDKFQRTMDYLRESLDSIEQAWIEAGLKQAALAELQPAADGAWKSAVIDQLVIAHILTAEHESDPLKAIQDLLAYHADIAVDPRVSGAAAKLVERTKEACGKACMEEAGKWPYPSHGNAAASMCAKMIFDMRQK